MTAKIKISDLPEFDMAEHLPNEQAIAEYLTVVLEEDDPAALADALGTIARARGMTEIAKASMTAAPAKPLERPPSTPPKAIFPAYAPYPVDQVFGIQEDFYSPSSVSRIREVVADVVRCEGPISLQLACRRVAAHWGFKQIRGQVMERVIAKTHRRPQRRQQAGRRDVDAVQILLGHAHGLAVILPQMGHERADLVQEHHARKDD